MALGLSGIKRTSEDAGSKPQPLLTQSPLVDGPKSVIREVMNVDTGKPSSSLPELTPEIKPTPKAPLLEGKPR
jgi:hypothetical protein